ncbi:hypothetical protein WKG92_19610 [Pantoea agglomerans]|uniref:hypothetical protein n=1 Tax=Enterobacter agglomerans TaxID=549 RepID=UPI003C7E72ED
MSKSLEKRCIRAWRLQLRGKTDSLTNPYWGGTGLRDFCRYYGVASAASIIEREAEEIAHKEWRNETGLVGWSPAFSDWFSEHRPRFEYAARLSLESGDASIEIEDEISCEIEHWNA